MKRAKRMKGLVCEPLEPRLVLSSFQPIGLLAAHPVIVAGDPKGAPPTDSPANRIDPNTTASPFAGVGSLQITASSGTYICTGTPIDSTHVITAGHCVDINDDGVPDVTAITFNLNYGGTLTSQIPASAWQTHPNFTGFASPSLNDDLTIVTLGAPLPAGVPTYSLASSDMVAGSTHLYMVGYGQSGDGVKGYYVNASFTVKRHGENIADAFYTQDDAGQPAANEVFRFDFDGRRSNTNVFGAGTLGNDKETTLGGGDSGGPSFVLCTGCNPSLASSYQLAGVNTFTQGFTAPKFGSLGGGINLYPYTSWINGVTGGGSGGGSTGGTGGGGGAALGNARGRPEVFVIVPGDVDQFTSVAATASGVRNRQTSTDPAGSTNSLDRGRQETAEPVAVVQTVGALVAADRPADRANDSYLNMLDAVIEDWPALIDG